MYVCIYQRRTEKLKRRGGGDGPYAYDEQEHARQLSRTDGVKEGSNVSGKRLVIDCLIL